MMKMIADSQWGGADAGGETGRPQFSPCRFDGVDGVAVAWEFDLAGSRVPFKGPDFGIRLDVPLVCQTRALSCWYAGARMVAGYREAGPRLGLPDVLLNDRRLTLPEMDQLAEVEGLSTLLLPNIGRFSAADLYALLQRHGPLWCAGEWGAIQNGHVIVLTGVDGNHIYYNDPEPVNVGTKDKAGTVDWFNENLLWRINNPILYRDA